MTSSTTIKRQQDHQQQEQQGAQRVSTRVRLVVELLVELSVEMLMELLVEQLVELLEYLISSFRSRAKTGLTRLYPTGAADSIASRIPPAQGFKKIA